MRRLLCLALAVGAFGCTEKNPDYCADAGAYRKSCYLYDAALQDMRDAGDAAHVAEARDAVEAGDAADANDVAEARDVMEAAPEAKPPVCVVDEHCRPDGGTAVCGTVDGGPMCVECTTNTHCGTAAKPVCDPAVLKCVECTGAAANAGMECKVDPKRVCLVASQSCVQCLNDSTCTGVTPKCEANVCRACKSDAECGGGQGVCLDTGACAVTEVLFVEFNAAGCPLATGASDKPFCSPTEAITAVAAGKGPTIVIKGPASGVLSFNTPVTTSITVVGRKNGAGEAPTISLGVLTGVQVSMGTVLVRDLAITGGAAASAKGAFVSGANSSLTLRRVTIDTGTGLGVQADTSAALVMDQCIVRNNPMGGLLVNGASYKVTNSVFATSAYGVKFNVPKTPTSFSFNTVVANTGNAVTCDPNNAQTLSASIVVGTNDSCTLSNCLTMAPVFDAARPFHLTAHLACPATPSPALPYDIDSDPRITPIDCGADQFK